MSEISPDLSDLLNSIVDGHIESFDIHFEEGKLRGDNFLGEIRFVNLKNRKTNEQLYLVVKQTLEGIGKFEFFATIYPIEINFYETIWPVLNKFQEKCSVRFNKVAKYYGSIKTKGKEKIVLENLRKQNFQMYDKTKVFNKQQIQYVVKNYAVFHAISYAFKEFYPEEFQRFKCLTNQKPFPSTELIPEEISGFIHLVKISLDHIRSLFTEKSEEDILKSFENATSGSILNIFKQTMHQEDTPVLLHGDCWSNNMLFKYDGEGNVVDMRFLDFQMISIGSPVNDLSYCIYSGTSKEILDQLDDLLAEYIKSFSETLKLLNCNPQEPYTLEKLKAEWKKYSLYGFCMGALLWRTKLLDKSKIPTVNDVASGHGIMAIAKEHVEMHDKLMKDLVIHFYENKYI